MIRYKLWSIAKRLYNGDAESGKRRVASFKKIQSAADELIQQLNQRAFNWKKTAGYIPLYGEREFENHYLRVSAVREVFEQAYEDICDGPLDRVKISFEWVAREKDYMAPWFCFEVRKPRNWKSPKLRLLSASGTPAQLSRFVSVIVNEVDNLKEVKFS
ncbi:hypothetical protein A2572_04310 [Candidatus Collierbacteria bacterium RIFOXYD1_FULL_40_9]|uniref:Uncharacterized protein n=1 Tax=Candidatus Collierbacteria bacterium RIFOXYD1_FULL_40_9 TaxID=1817731 RepID=A0A1F5FPP5_9BACT|nr:MAG: hypothetical protein A2572_04310 [Candidatus Collierbacteria bacterium RIFOXYD1_FULL_40_9]